jgi:Tfp pilus assembly protein PilN
MKRINYLTSWSERRLGVALPSSVAPRLRAPLAALAAALALVGLLWMVQATRLHAAEREGVAYAQRLAAIEIAVARVRVVERDVARLRILSERVAEVRGSGARSASEVAALGNRIPAGAWLTLLRADRAALALEGRSARIDTVGSMIAALAGLPPYVGARLVTLRDDPVRADVTYAIEVDRKR